MQIDVVVIAVNERCDDLLKGRLGGFLDGLPLKGLTVIVPIVKRS